MPERLTHVAAAPLNLASTKDFLTTFAASLAAEHAEDGIDVLVIVRILLVFLTLLHVGLTGMYFCVAPVAHQFQLLQQRWQDVRPPLGSEDFLTTFCRG